MLNERNESIEALFAIPFTSQRKCMTTVIRHPREQGKVRVMCKGAPEILLEKCWKSFQKSVGYPFIKELDLHKKLTVSCRFCCCIIFPSNSYFMKHLQEKGEVQIEEITPNFSTRLASLLCQAKTLFIQDTKNDTTDNLSIYI